LMSLLSVSSFKWSIFQAINDRERPFPRETIHLASNFKEFSLFFSSEFFTDLLAASKLRFHKLFQRTYGIIYERNSDVFIDFFRDLEDYYDRGEVDLEDALRRFFGQLYQRMFTVFNAQQSFDYT